MKNKEIPSDVIEKALLKKALGYDASEIIEEYVIDEDGNEKLSKRKVTKKHISPDIPAAKVLLEHYSGIENNKYEKMSDEELQIEKIKLIKLLGNKGEDDGD